MRPVIGIVHESIIDRLVRLKVNSFDIFLASWHEPSGSVALHRSLLDGSHRPFPDEMPFVAGTDFVPGGYPLSARRIVMLILTAASYFCGPVAYSTDLGSREEQFDQLFLPMLEDSCLECHSGAEPAAGLALQHFKDVPSILKERRTWHKVLQRVEIGDMPPLDAEQLSDEKRREFVSWFRQLITEVDCGKTPNPGRVTLRRLNRQEYRNTVRDLLGVDYSSAADFPGDDVGYGFDNIGDVLTLPPILMEKYLAAAEEISATAIKAPEPGKQFEAVRSGQQLPTGDGINQGDGRLDFYANGATSFSEQVPWAGTFAMELSLGATQAGNEPPLAAVFIDDKKIREIPVLAKMNDPEVYTLSVRLRAGKRTVKIAFVNDFYVEARGNEPAQDRNLYLYNIRLSGRQAPKPLSPTELPLSHKKLVIAEPTSEVTAEEAIRKVISPIASRAFRRPATQSELDRLVELCTQVHEGGESYEASLQVGIQALLVSPHFLFKMESPPEKTFTQEYPMLNSFELATRLSYFLWSTMPDQRLFQLARSNQLQKPEVMKVEVKRMIDDSRSMEFVENFAAQWLTLRKLDLFQPNPQMFPSWNDQVRGLARRETLTFFHGVMKDDLSILTLLDADFTYLNEPLANFYGISGVNGPDFRKVSLQGQPRLGLLTQASILAVTSNPTRTSPVKRGKWILDNLLGAPPPNAPPGVPELEKVQVSGTLREQMEQHRADPACAGCHKLMDPLGLALENFDAIGQWRTHEEGRKIDASGTLPNGSAVQHAGDLIRTLRSKHSDDFVRCLTEKMLCFALGRGLEYYDRCAVDQIVARLRADEFRFSALATEIVLSDPFQKHGVTQD